MRNPALFYGAIIAAVLCVILAIYYFTPGIYHPFTMSPPYERHPTHAATFTILAIICIVVALVNRRRSAR